MKNKKLTIELGFAIRQNLTDEWKERGIKEQRDFSILTAEISKATFGMTPSEYKELKNLKRKNTNTTCTTNTEGRSKN